MHSISGDTVELFTELLFNSHDNTFDPDTVIRTVSGEFARVSLISSLLQDLETKGHNCKRCETQNFNHKLRFFALNQQMEVFKCESRKCMFPFRCFVFRDRRDQSYHTYKRQVSLTKPRNDSSNFEAIFDDFFASTDPETQPILTDLKPPVQYREETKLQAGDGLHSDTSQIEDILNELFPTTDDTEISAVEPLQLKPLELLPEIQIPVPEPPKTLSKSLSFMSKVKVPQSSVCSQPKNIRSPLELVKGLLQKTVSPDNHQLTLEPVKSPIRNPKGPQILNRNRKMEKCDSDDSVISDTRPIPMKSSSTRKTLRKQSTSPSKSTRSNTILSADLSSTSLPILDLDGEEKKESKPPKRPRGRRKM